MVVGESGDGLKVVDEVCQVMPDVVVLDVTIPGLNGLDLCREITRRAPGVRVLMLTMHAGEQFVISAWRTAPRATC